MTGIRPNKEQFIELMNAPDDGPVVITKFPSDELFVANAY